MVETLQRGGHRKTYGNPGTGEIGEYIVVWPEWVIGKTVITPDGDGLAVSITGETWSVDGTPPVVQSLFDDSIVTGLSDPEPSVPIGEPWDLGADRTDGWMSHVERARLRATGCILVTY